MYPSHDCVSTTRCITVWLALVFMWFFPVAVIYAQPLEPMHAAKIHHALRKLNTLGSVLYIAAHPDDENTAFIAYCSTERMLRTTYLSLTRGDGGQNIIGSEQSELLGIIRTQELLAARRIDGGEQMFTRAIDFGYSKTPEETLSIWGKERILADVVWAIRKTRPDVVVTRFPATGEGGHGHHTASALLAMEAYNAAADPSRFPEQLQYVKVWKPKRLLWNAWLPILESRKAHLPSYFPLNLNVYNPLLGKSATELAAESRSMHKSQGFGSSPLRGEAINYFEHLAGDSAIGDIFSGIDISWNRIKGGAEIRTLIEQAQREFRPEQPSHILSLLGRIYQAMNALQKSTGESFWIPQKRRELLDIIRSCSGMWIEAIAHNQPQQGETGFSGVPGGVVRISASIVNRSPAKLILRRVLFPFAGDSLVNKQLLQDTYQTITVTKTIPASTPISQPYWLRLPPSNGAYTIEHQTLIGQAENSPTLEVSFVVVIDDEELQFTVPVLHRRTDRVMGEVYRPFIIVPPVALHMPQRSWIFPDTSAREVRVIIQANAPALTGVVRLRLPSGWTASPNQLSFSLANKGDEMQASFRVNPPPMPIPTYSSETLLAEAVIGTKASITTHHDMITIAYPHIPTQVVFPEARARLTRIDLRATVKSIGYIDGASDNIAEYLKQCGFHVTLLSDDEIETGDLSRYDAIVAGVRVYNDNARPRLRQQYQRLMDYIANGGTMIVQYQLASGLITDKIGPYPFTISRERVTQEDAPVHILKPEHPVLTTPNLITQEDFQGWVQERGLYFASTWDNRYEPLLACNDAGEPERKGGILFARYGKGVFIYTGYAWFRQLPSGVPGAYRLFTNLLHAAHTLRTTTSPTESNK
ncbi:MAG: PIG-L family deacetylase [Bacteroidota bacterium]|nr:PIG-L family deacetylase [Candidatus Kapabacteria bacterium]MDW8219088.1 PIG-L family deacetylase [Bacteroidota bacterium]